MAVGGTMQQPETTAAESGGVRLDHGQRRRNRDSGIEGIAAALENLVARRGRQGMRRSDCRIFFLRRRARKK